MNMRPPPGMAGDRLTNCLTSSRPRGKCILPNSSHSPVSQKWRPIGTPYCRPKWPTTWSRTGSEDFSGFGETEIWEVVWNERVAKSLSFAAYETDNQLSKFNCVGIQ